MRAAASTPCSRRTTRRRADLSHRTSCGQRERKAARLRSAAVKVLLVTLYWPPAGGGGVQRPLKIATHLPALGIETHVLAPDDSKWVHTDDELVPPTQAFVHRARYLGPKARLPSEELRGLSGFDLALAQARLAGRRLLLP